MLKSLFYPLIIIPSFWKVLLHCTAKLKKRTFFDLSYRKTGSVSSSPHRTKYNCLSLNLRTCTISLPPGRCPPLLPILPPPLLRLCSRHLPAVCCPWF